jgi:hypothetical protein
MTDPKAWARVTARAWTDPTYKSELMKNPKKVLNEAGIETAGRVEVHEERDDTISHFVLPKRPAHLSDEDLKNPDPRPDICCHA